jgi:hypothetical protein
MSEHQFARDKAAQHSVQRTAGSLRGLGAFSTPRQNPPPKPGSCPPSRR